MKRGTSSKTSLQLAALVAALLLSLVSGQAFAQTGIGEADINQGSEEEEKDALQDPSVANEQDAMSNRPTVTITRPEVPRKKDGKTINDADVLEASKTTRDDSGLTYRVNILTKVNARDNLDFRTRDETSRQATLQSDDRLIYGANQARLGVTYAPVDTVSVTAGVGHNGLWGGDSLKNVTNSNTLFVDTLYFTWTAVDTPDFKLTARLGRQYYEVGGAAVLGGAKRDYFLWDVVDGATIDFDMMKGGRVRVLAVDFVGLQFRPDEVDFISRQDSTSSTLNQRGDTTTYRTGLVYENTELVEGLELRAFGFYADIGGGDLGRSTGTDICYGGELCNIPDNDYNWMAGARAGYYFENEEKTMRVGGYGEYARSGGIDRKDQRVNLFDVANDGNAFGVAATGFFELAGQFTLGVEGQFFRADGASYASQNGMQFNHGFVSFKGAHVGGLGVDDNAGWHPSAYIGGSMGVEDMAQDQRRKAGTQTIFAGLSFGMVELFELSAGAWLLQDTGTSLIPEANYDEAARDLPFGYSAADIQAQKRLGKTLGTELDLGLTYLASNTLSIFAQGSVFLPGDFYKIEIDQAGGTALGSANAQNFWAVAGGMAIQFE